MTQSSLLGWVGGAHPSFVTLKHSKSGEKQKSLVAFWNKAAMTAFGHSMFGTRCISNGARLAAPDTAMSRWSFGCLIHHWSGSVEWLANAGFNSAGAIQWQVPNGPCFSEGGSRWRKRLLRHGLCDWWSQRRHQVVRGKDIFACFCCFITLLCPLFFNVLRHRLPLLSRWEMLAGSSEDTMAR